MQVRARLEQLERSRIAAVHQAEILQTQIDSVERKMIDLGWPATLGMNAPQCCEALLGRTVLSLCVQSLVKTAWMAWQLRGSSRRAIGFAT